MSLVWGQQFQRKLAGPCCYQRTQRLLYVVNMTCFQEIDHHPYRPFSTLKSAWWGRSSASRSTGKCLIGAVAAAHADECELPETALALKPSTMGPPASMLLGLMMSGRVSEERRERRKSKSPVMGIAEKNTSPPCLLSAVRLLEWTSSSLRAGQTITSEEGARRASNQCRFLCR
jgi:hypothetical protein